MAGYVQITINKNYTKYKYKSQSQLHEIKVIMYVILMYQLENIKHIMKLVLDGINSHRKYVTLCNSKIDKLQFLISAYL